LAWAVKVTDAAWFTALIKEDLGSATQVAQAVAALSEEGPALGRPLVDRLKGSAIHHLKDCVPDRGAARRSGSYPRSTRPIGAAAARRRQGRELAALVPRQHPDRRAAPSRLHRRGRGV